MQVPMPTAEENRIYEIAVLYPYPLNQKEESDLLKEIESLFAEANGKVVFKDVWGRRGLAYPIGGATEGAFIIYYCELDPKKLKELDRSLRILKGVHRHLIVKPPKHYEIVSYAEKYKEWQQSAGQRQEAETREREEEIKRKVAEKAKRQVKRAETKKKETEETKKAPLEKEALSAELEKLISDDELSL